MSRPVVLGLNWFQYKSLGTPQLNKAYVQRALMDENVQYLLLALYWYLQKPIYITLIPFATFSLFHTRKHTTNHSLTHSINHH